MRHDLINIKAKTKTRQDNDDNDTERTPWKSDTRDLWCSRHWSHVWQLRTTIITFIVTLQLRVTGGSIRNTCDVFFYLKMGKITVKLWLLKQINYHPLLILRCNVIELGGQINCLTKNKSNIVTDKKYGCPWGGVRGGGGCEQMPGILMYSRKGVCNAWAGNLCQGYKITESATV